MTVSLRPLAADDAPWLDTWLAAVAVSVGYDAIDARAPAAALLARLRRERPLRACVIERDRDAAGLVVYRLHARGKDVALFEIVATPPERARSGSGMRAAALAEDEMRATGARTSLAPAPAVHGIDVYFWIRLGYRPLQRADWPCERAGVAWMARDLR